MTYDGDLPKDEIDISVLEEEKEKIKKEMNSLKARLVIMNVLLAKRKKGQ